MNQFNEFEPRNIPGQKTLTGRYVVLEPLNVSHTETDLADNLAGQDNSDIWVYMPIGPFTKPDRFVESFQEHAKASNWRPLVIKNIETGNCLGSVSYMRLRPEHGSCEIGAVAFGHKLQRTTLATEAVYLMATHVFDDLGYRRFEWKCNNDNTASKRAAIRFGFRYEGLFRQDMVVKGKNRDTAWYSIIDEEWPDVKANFEVWLSPENFNSDGTQKVSLNELRLRCQMRTGQQQ